MASLLNQLFGKGKEPFWQQAYTNLVRWIIELYRVLPHPRDGSDTPGWVTLRDVYHCAIDKDLFAKKIKEAQTFARDRSDEWITIDRATMNDETKIFALDSVGFQPHPARPGRLRAHADPARMKHLKANTITYDLERFESASTTEIRLRVEAVNRWYVHDWNTLDNKIRSSIVEGISVFLSMFDLPSVARVFCPPAPLAVPVLPDQTNPYETQGGSRPHAGQEDGPPPAPRPAHRERARPGAQHARRHQPGACPRRRRHAQKCVAAIPVTTAGGGEARPRPLRPPGRLYL